MTEGVEVELLVEAGAIAFGAEGEELVGEVHEDAVVAGGVIGEGGLELGGHEGGVAGGVEEVVKAGEELVSGGVLEDEAATDAAAEGKELGDAKALGETGIAGEDDAEELARIELLGGEDSDLVEDGGEGLLGLVDDEDGAAHRLGDVVGPAGAQGLKAAPAVVGGEGTLKTSPSSR